MKQTVFIPVTILAGLALAFLAPQAVLSADESPRLQQQGNGPRKERSPDRPDRGREPMHDHKQFSNDGGPVMDRLMRRFDEVIARLDRIEHRVGAGHDPNGHRPPHGPDHGRNEERKKEEGRRHDFERQVRDAINGRIRQSEDMAEQVHQAHEEMRDQLEERMHQARGMMGQARERFMELNDRVEELEEEVRGLQERIEDLQRPAEEISRFKPEAAKS